MRLAHAGPWAVSAGLAAFAGDIFSLDETRLDTIGRYLKPLRDLSTHDAACFAGKLVGLFDLRRQRWSRLEWRKDVRENCRVDMLDFLQGLSAGSLLLFDLGYFSFSLFDTLTQRKVWWISRYRENTSYSIAHAFYRHCEKLDALIWLGTGQKQARHLMRLVRLASGVGVRMVTRGVLSMGVELQICLFSLAESYSIALLASIGFPTTYRISIFYFDFVALLPSLEMLSEGKLIRFLISSTRAFSTGWFVSCNKECFPLSLRSSLLTACDLHGAGCVVPGK